MLILKHLILTDRYSSPWCFKSSAYLEDGFEQRLASARLPTNILQES